jgi:hypothetical protein
VFGQHSGECGLSASDVSGYCNVHVCCCFACKGKAFYLHGQQNGKKKPYRLWGNKRQGYDV